MDTTFLGIWIAVVLAVGMVCFFDVRHGSRLLLVVGGCALLGGLGEWMFGDFLRAWDNSVGGAAMQHTGLIIAIVGLLAVVYAIGLSKRANTEE